MTNGKNQSVGCIGIQFDGIGIVSSIIDANVNKSDFATNSFDHLVVYDVKEVKSKSPEDFDKAKLVYETSSYQINKV